MSAARAVSDREGLPVRGGVSLAASPAALQKVNGPDLSGSAGIFPGRRCDPRAFQRIYPDRWHGFLKAHFRNSVEVAAFFDVNEKTARLWMEGCNAPRGWAVAYAVARLPSAAKYLLGAA